MTVKADVEVLKTHVEQIKRGFDDHITQNREDFKEVHSRMSTMKREISDEINLTFEKLYYGNMSYLATSNHWFECKTEETTY